ncbi:MAG: primase C-terminal domain-containing protein, partial [Candidatus Nanopelagicales bacterium]
LCPQHMPERGWRKAIPVEHLTGLGRNCALFETSRHWAYRELRHWFGNPQGLSDAIHGQVQIRNQAFREPLPTIEASGIARSIARWITTHSRMWQDGPVVYDATFSLIQSARSRKGSRKGGLKSGEKRGSVRRAMIDVIEGDAK